MEKFIKRFSETGLDDIAEVGGKNAALGEMFNNLVPKGLRIPDGFAVTVAAFKHFILSNELQERLRRVMEGLERKEFSNLNETGAAARKLIMDARFSRRLELEITDAYNSHFSMNEQGVAVRSSATAEDLADASFAGQHESFLNIKGPIALVYAIKCCFASLYTTKAIKYREDKGFDHNKVFLSVGIQQMVRSDIGSSGIGFTPEPESGFPDIIHLTGTWGLGENIVQGTVTPDEFLVFKPSVRKNIKTILRKNLGSKNNMMVYKDVSAGTNSTVNKVTPRELREKFVLDDDEVIQLSEWALILEEHYKRPMDFEWAKDGLDHQLYIIQAKAGNYSIR